MTVTDIESSNPPRQGKKTGFLPRLVLAWCSVHLVSVPPPVSVMGLPLLGSCIYSTYKVINFMVTFRISDTKQIHANHGPRYSQQPDTGLLPASFRRRPRQSMEQICQFIPDFLLFIWNLAISCAVRSKAKELLAPSVCRIIVVRLGCSSFVHLSVRHLLLLFLYIIFCLCQELVGISSGNLLVHSATI